MRQLATKSFPLPKPALAIFIVASVIVIFYWLAAPRHPFIAMTDIPGAEEKNESGPDQYPTEWAWLQRTFPYFTADRTAHVEALQQAQHMQRLAKSLTPQAKWNFAGPTNIGGRVSALAINPKNPEIVYAGAATGGVFKSVDRGATWKPIFDEQAVLPIGDIVIDPQNPEVLYVGTGEANGGHNNFPGAGVFKSTDAGASWQLVGLENTTSIGRIVVDPVNSNRVYVAAIGSYFGSDPERGVYRSTDAGKSWKKVLSVNDSTGAIDLIINPQNPSTLFAAVWERVRRHNRSHLTGESSGIYRTDDGGNTWQRLGTTNGLPGPSPTIGRIGLAICAKQPENLYALYTINSTYGALYRSKDGGRSWTRTDPNNALQSGFGTFSWYFGNVRVHPDDPEQVFVLDVSFMASFDGGRTWPIKYGYGGGPIDLHVDHHALVFDPADSKRLIVGNDGGINISHNSGYQWIKVEALPVTQFYHITIDPSNPQRLYGGTQDNGTIRTLSGALNDWEGIYGGDGFYVLVDPGNPNIIYAEYQWGGLGKSTDGGRSFHNALTGIDPNEPTNWSTPVVMDPSNSNVLYYGSNRVYRTVDGANSWQPISDNLTDARSSRPLLGTVTTIAVAPSNPAVIYAGTDDSHVWVTADSGATWREISAALPYRWVTRVAVDHTDARIAYVTFSGLKWNSPQPHVFRTTDMGTTWEDISSNLPDAPVNTIVIDPRYPNLLYVGTDVGAFYSRDYGKHWLPLGEGMPIVSVYDLAIHHGQRRLAAGTHGRSMYTFDLSLITNAEEPVSENIRFPVSPALAQNHPNPFNPSTTIEFVLPVSAQVSLKIYNAAGQQICSLVNETLAAGRHRLLWDGRDGDGKQVASGTYIYRLQVGQHVQQKKLLLLR
ncbi:MAG: T9SS type A sorting domain-containing protein [candidate division KSB1 bacterium]|nr:T9SS type A sorting domain-containing protein [candidate division KSB1 bacterium]MDZ7304758.1 T9SS type A sorting domain-containing protein [candidate division KSB1 bacterium]MDZ7314208.1 T9SS type A sorting domain-containing protein [candidate division KSB1 bacterium]